MGIVVGLSAGLLNVESIILEEDEKGNLGAIGEPLKYNSPAAREDLKDQVARLILGLRQTLRAHDRDIADVEAIGIAHPSQVDSGAGKIIYNAALQIRDFDIVQEFHNGLSKAKLPDIATHVLRDVSAMAIGERELGTGKDRQVENLIYIFVDAGIGAAFILNGELYEGHRSVAGEFGNIIVKPGGLAGNSGIYGCIEAYSSRKAISSRVLSTARQIGILEYITDIPNINEENAQSKLAIETLADALKEPDMQEIMSEGVQVLGLGIANLINLFNPQAIILGGELIESLEDFRNQVIRIALNNALSDNRRDLFIEKASLSPYAEVYGAAVFAKSKVNPPKHSGKSK